MMTFVPSWRGSENGQCITVFSVTYSKPHTLGALCLAVTYNLHLWQNDLDLLLVTAVTCGWNGYRNKSQHRVTESWPWRRKFSCLSLWDSNPRPFDHESDHLPLSYPRSPFAVNCAGSWSVVRLFTCDLVTCVLNWCRFIFLFLWMSDSSQGGDHWLCAADGMLKSKN